MTSEDDLRRILAEQAEQAPDGEPLAERALASLQTEAAPRHLRRWVIPAVAAASLVVAASAAAVGIKTVTDKPTAGPVHIPSTVSSVTVPTTPPTPGRTQAQSSTARRRTPPRHPAFAAAGVSFDAARQWLHRQPGMRGTVPRHLLRQPVGAGMDPFPASPCRSAPTCASASA